MHVVAIRKALGTTCWYQKRYFIECYKFDDVRRWCFLRYKVDGVWKYTECGHTRWIELCHSWPCPCWLYKDLSVKNAGDDDNAGDDENTLVLTEPGNDPRTDVDAILQIIKDQGKAQKMGPFSDDGSSYPPINEYVKEFALRVKRGQLETFTVMYEEVLQDFSRPNRFRDNTRNILRFWHIIAGTTTDQLVYLPVKLTFADSTEKFSRGDFTISNRLINRVPMGGVGMGTDRGLDGYDIYQTHTVGKVRPSRREFFIDDDENNDEDNINL